MKTSAGDNSLVPLFMRMVIPSSRPPFPTAGSAQTTFAADKAGEGRTNAEMILIIKWLLDAVTGGIHAAAFHFPFTLDSFPSPLPEHMPVM